MSEQIRPGAPTGSVLDESLDDVPIHGSDQRVRNLQNGMVGEEESVSPESPESLVELAKIPPAYLSLHNDAADEAWPNTTLVVSCLSPVPMDDAELRTRGAKLLEFLGQVHYNRHKEQGKLDDINTAVGYSSQALLILPETSTEKPRVLNSVSIYQQTRFLATGEVSDLSRAVEFSIQAVSLVPDGHQDKPMYLNNLATAYFHRFEYLGGLADLDFALECSTQAVSLTPNDHSDQPSYLSNLGAMYGTRYSQLGQLSDLHNAVHHLIQGISSGRKNHPDRPGWFNNLGLSLLTRYERLGDLSDLNTAIKHMYDAVSLVPDDNPDRHAYLSNLGNGYWRRYEHLCDFAALAMAVEYHSQAVSLTPDGHSQKPLHLCNLGAMYLTRYLHLGHLADSDAAITCYSQAATFIPDGHPATASLLCMWGNSYQMRFERLGQMAELDMAMDLKHQAVLLAHDGHSEKSKYLHSLASAYKTRFNQLGQLTDLDMTLELQTQAVFLVPEDHPDKPLLLASLGVTYCTRYQQYEGLPDLILAIQYLQQAVALVPEGHLNSSHILSTLSDAYHIRHKCLNLPEDMDLAIHYQRLAISCIDDGHIDNSRLITDLGYLHVSRSRYWNEASEKSSAVECFKHAAQSPVGHPHVKAVAAGQWARILLVQRQFQPALAAYQYFMSLVPQVVWLGLAFKQRYDQVVKIAGTTLEAAMAASLLQGTGQALEWLEQGRSIVWNQLVQLRSPLDELHMINPLLADELIQVSDELQSGPGVDPQIVKTAQSQMMQEQASQRYRRLVERWEWLVHQAQSLPGMDHFLAPRTASQLVTAARGRAIVVVLTSGSSCGAVVIRPGAADVEFIPLMDLSYDKLVRAREQLQRQPYSTARADRKFTTAPESDNVHDSVLCMLWTGVAKPVLDFLGYADVLSVSELPHITWCTTGLLSFLPLHAAGDYTKPHCSLFDYCISSYTPTIGTLLAPPHSSTQFSGIAMIGQASTPGCTPLPGTKLELDQLVDRAQGIPTTRLEAESAGCNAVLDAMERHSWVHLACHASQNGTDPIASAFHLHDGSLTLAAISQKQLKHAEFAFLSACETATGDSVLSEEAVHLAAGMIMAGYRTVIATMWSIDDGDAPLVADRFYEYMLKDGIPDARKAARALHYAVGCLRDHVGVDAYMRWSPYIHIGI